MATTTGFLDLPRELRDKIYFWYIFGARRRRISKARGEAARVSDLMNVLLLNKQVHNEFFATIFREYTFIQRFACIHLLTNHPVLSINCSPCRWDRAIWPSNYSKFLKSLAIHVYDSCDPIIMDLAPQFPDEYGMQILGTCESLRYLSLVLEDRIFYPPRLFAERKRRHWGKFLAIKASPLLRLNLFKKIVALRETYPVFSICEQWDRHTSLDDGLPETIRNMQRDQKFWNCIPSIRNEKGDLWVAHLHYLKREENKCETSEDFVKARRNLEQAYNVWVKMGKPKKGKMRRIQSELFAQGALVYIRYLFVEDSLAP